MKCRQRKKRRHRRNRRTVLPRDHSRSAACGDGPLEQADVPDADVDASYLLASVLKEDTLACV